MLVGNVASIILGGVVTVVVSLATVKKMPHEETVATWEKTLRIDNPLYPWSELYSK